MTLTTVQRNRNCLDCGRPIVTHDHQQCPRGSVTAAVRALWASFGTRQPSRGHHDGCPCAQCSHS